MSIPGRTDFQITNAVAVGDGNGANEDAESPSISKCQGQYRTGPCGMDALQNHDGVTISRFCLAHGGWREKKKEAYMVGRNYLLGKHAKRVSELSSGADVKSLREEIGILRLLVEKTFTSMDDGDDTQLLLRSPEISKLIADVRMTVEACDRIETKMGLSLDKTQVAALADAIVATITDALNDSPALSEEERNQIIEKVVDGVSTAIERASSGPVAERTNTSQPNNT